MKKWQILGLIIAMPGYYLLALLLYAIVKPDPNNAWGALLYTTSQVIGFILLLFVSRQEGGGFKSIYIGKLGFKEFSFAIGLWFIAFMLYLPINYALNSLGITFGRWGYSIVGLNIIPVSIWAIGAAFFEEAFFRGYTLTRLPNLIKNMPASITISVIAFALIHLRFGLGLFVYMLVWATIISYLFVLTKSTWACFSYHLINNIVVDFIIYGR